MSLPDEKRRCRAGTPPVIAIADHMGTMWAGSLSDGRNTDAHDVCCEDGRGAQLIAKNLP